MKPLALALVAITLVAAVPARGQDAAFVVGGLSIVPNRSVVRELRATDEQARALAALAALVNERFLAGLAAGEEPGRFGAMVARADAELHAALGQVLDPGQVARFDQLAIRAAGLDAFATARVREALQLTGGQEARLRDLGSELRMAPREDRGQVAELERRLVTEFVALMTAEQRATWAALAGEPFELVEDPVVQQD